MLMGLQVDCLTLERFFRFALYRRGFMVRRLYGWYREHFRAFELSPARETVLVELGELADDYPLADYFVGPLRMVTLKRHIDI